MGPWNAACFQYLFTNICVCISDDMTLACLITDLLEQNVFLFVTNKRLCGSNSRGSCSRGILFTKFIILFILSGQKLKFVSFCISCISAHQR